MKKLLLGAVCLLQGLSLQGLDYNNVQAMNKHERALVRKARNNPDNVVKKRLLMDAKSVAESLLLHADYVNRQSTAHSGGTRPLDSLINKYQAIVKNIVSLEASVQKSIDDADAAKKQAKIDSKNMIIAKKKAAQAERHLRELDREVEASKIGKVNEAEWNALDKNIKTAGRIAESMRHQTWDDLDQNLQVADKENAVKNPHVAKLESEFKALKDQYGEQASDHLANIHAWANTPV